MVDVTTLKGNSPAKLFWQGSEELLITEKSITQWQAIAGMFCESGVLFFDQIWAKKRVWVEALFRDAKPPIDLEWIDTIERMGHPNKNASPRECRKRVATLSVSR